MKSLNNLLLIFLILFSSNATYSFAQETEFNDFDDLELQSLLNQTIVSASKHEERLMDSPTSVTVITAEEIARSGALSIPELLRFVPGLEVMQVTSSAYNISARGFNKLVSNKMLILLDGRTLYIDFFGSIDWNTFPVALAEIDRIEIIRGPGSALYGANAYNGIIHILTRKISGESGATYSFYAGNQNQILADGYVSGSQDKFHYKASVVIEKVNQWRDNVIDIETATRQAIELDLQAQLQEIADQNQVTVEQVLAMLYPGLTYEQILSGVIAENWDFAIEQIEEVAEPINEYRIIKEGLRSGRGNVSCRYDYSENMSLALSGGISFYKTESVIPFLPGITHFNNELHYVMSDAAVNKLFQDADELTIKAFWNAGLMDVENEFDERFVIDYDTYNIDVQHRLNVAMLKKSHRFIYGFNYRRNFVKSDLFSDESLPYKDYSQDLLAGFWQMEFYPITRLKMIYGERYDDHPEVGLHRSPRAGLVFGLTDRHTVRASFGQAFRNPTFLESYIHNGSYRGGHLGPNPYHPDEDYATLRQGHDLDAETVKSFEMGYQGIWLDRIKLQVDAFAEELDNFINPISLTADRDNFYFNYGGAKNKGFEISTEFILHKQVRLLANYAWQDLEDVDLDTTAVREEVPPPYHREEETFIQFAQNAPHAPSHKINVGLRLNIPPKLTTYLNVHHVTATDGWSTISMVSGSYPSPELKVDAYTVANLSIHYQLTPHLALNVTVQNLFDEKHSEYPQYPYLDHPELAFLNVVEGEELGRLWLLGLKITP